LTAAGRLTIRATARGGSSLVTGFVSGVLDGVLGATAGPDGSVLPVFRGVSGRVHQSKL
jgi:alpha-galactosidase